LLFLSGLSSAAPDGEARKIKVVTSFLPVWCFTVNVAGDLAEVENLLPPGAEPHDFQFSPREMRKLNAADLVIVNGLGLESWLDKPIHSTDAPKIVVEAAANLSSSELIHFRPGLAGAREGGKETSGAFNPHIWLDPRLAGHSVSNILQALQKADPVHASGYEANAQRYLGRLKKLDADFAAALANAKDKPFVTLHDAFPYLARRYGLKIAGVIEQTPDVEPSLKYLSELGRLIREEHVRVIFTERSAAGGSENKVAEQLGRDYHVPVAALDTLETGKFKPEAYEDGMRRNLQELAKYLK
ncbi:MAG TPA: zinc ABC transporter substrate-binding protein, partial [Verrucomicrobiae bacterium]|nr:zinc ABC transporter substrate-binding protein [Verrucomicrobiae bacterium]